MDTDGTRAIIPPNVPLMAKTPRAAEIFDADEIPNDLAMVDRAICEYYEIGGYNNDSDSQ